MGLFEMNAAAEIIHGVAHADANIIFGTVVDDEIGDEIRVTVIAAGFDRLDGPITGSQPKTADVDHRSVRRRSRPARARRRRRLRRAQLLALGFDLPPVEALPVRRTLRTLRPTRRRASVA